MANRGWVPEDQRDTAWWLFEHLYDVCVPYIGMRSAADLREFGMPFSGDPIQDHATAREPVHCKISINDMVEYRRQGTTVEIMNRNDCADIYQRVGDHLMMWKAVIENTLNSGDVPWDDLEDLDEFRREVHPFAMATPAFTRAAFQSFLGRGIQSLAGLGKMQTLKSTEHDGPLVDNVNLEAAEEPPAPVYESITKTVQRPLQGGFLGGTPWK